MQKLRAKIQRKKPQMYELLGWYGTGAYLGAYVLISAGLVGPQSPTYQFLNLSGSLAFVIFAHNRRIYQSVLANGIWLLVGVFTLVSVLGQ